MEIYTYIYIEDELLVAYTINIFSNIELERKVLFETEEI